MLCGELPSDHWGRWIFGDIFTYLGIQTVEVLVPSLRTFPQVAYEELKYESHLCYHSARQSQVGVGNCLFRSTTHLTRNTNLLETCIPNSNLSFITQSFRDRFKVISCLLCFVFVTVVWSFLVTLKIPKVPKHQDVISWYSRSLLFLTCL